ncbi:MAG: hypothetical protein IPN72_19565 [Saprospiraceae bacterium]|nr:hypothetical protein [Saprospiraceae bacterium]
MKLHTATLEAELLHKAKLEDDFNRDLDFLPFYRIINDILCNSLKSNLIPDNCFVVISLPNNTSNIY